MAIEWILTLASSPDDVVKALQFSTCLRAWSYYRQRENLLADGRIVIWYEVNPQPIGAGHRGSAPLRQLEQTLRQCGDLCGSAQALQGPSTAGMVGLVQGVHNTIRIKDTLAVQETFHHALRCRRLAIARLCF